MGEVRVCGRTARKSARRVALSGSGQVDFPRTPARREPWERARSRCGIIWKMELVPDARLFQSLIRSELTTAARFLPMKKLSGFCATLLFFLPISSSAQVDRGGLPESVTVLNSTSAFNYFDSTGGVVVARYTEPTLRLFEASNDGVIVRSLGSRSGGNLISKSSFYLSGGSAEFIWSGSGGSSFMQPVCGVISEQWPTDSGTQVASMILASYRNSYNGSWVALSGKKYRTNITFTDNSYSLQTTDYSTGQIMGNSSGNFDFSRLVHLYIRLGDTYDNQNAYILLNSLTVRLTDPRNGIPKLIDTTPSPPDGRRFISYEMAKQELVRNVKDKVTVYLQLQIPEFASENGGWGASQAGMGTFYGLEMKTFSLINPFDSIHYKIGATPLTPATDWKSLSFNQILDTDLLRAKTTYYFKIGLAPGVLPLTVSARFQSARLCNEKGEPVTTLDASKRLWVVAHGRKDGEFSFRTMNQAVQKGAGSTQVVSLDWSNVAADKDSIIPRLKGGRYLVNLGKNMAALLKEKGFAGDNVNWVGHSWGTLVGYETARTMSRVNRFVALDPATQAFGDYDDTPVNFGKVSTISTSVKGGGKVEGPYGSETKAKTCDFSIRLYSESQTGDFKWPKFYHSLPRSWFVRAMNQHTSDVYWPFFNRVLMRNKEKPLMPWGDYGELFGFSLECHGATGYKENNSVFSWHEYLLYQAPTGKKIEARARINATASLSWTYRKQ